MAQEWWVGARSSLWLRPTLAVAVALVLGAMLSSIEVPESSWLDAIAFDGDVDAARGLLTVVVGTMITVTSLVFALTVVALQIASTQFSPRLLRSFLRDRGTQLVLSIFVGTVAYALAGLHNVGRPGPGGEAFVPRLAVSGALVLALASVGALVYYIQHVTDSIRIDTIMRRVEQTALGVLARDHPPREPGHEHPDDLVPPADAVVVASPYSGYLEGVARRGMVAGARRAGFVVRLVPSVGYFVVAGRPVAHVWRPDGDPVDPGVAAEVVGGHVVLARERLEEVEVGVGLRHLVDIANGASSTSTQDFYTSVQAVHHLSVVLADAAGRTFRTRSFLDGDGMVRVQVPVMNFRTHLDVVCDAVRQGGGDRHPRLAVALLRMLAVVGERAEPADLRVVLRQVDVICAHAEQTISYPDDRHQVREVAEGVRQALARVA